ncbi:MAG: response regulator [Myxococcales bacterium]|nr:response regulator [Myxococcales bacterium]MCB9626691.1 response regulator [Sandaracinaceae bacterium]
MPAGTRLEDAAAERVPFSLKGRAVDAVRAARVGVPKTLELPSGGRLICWPNDDDSVRVLITRPAARASEPALADLSGAASHEMANALTSILGWADVGLASPGASSSAALRAIKDSAESARAIADDILSMVRTADQEDSSATAADTVCGDVVRLITPQARRRSVEIIHRPGDDQLCRAPRNKLVSILWNLIHNAVSVAQPGGRVEVWVEPEGEAVLFNVRDDGPGMDRATRERAFEAYFTTREKGTGLGLSVVRSFVSTLNGKIELQTAPGRGAWFRIHIPTATLVPRRGSGVITRMPRVLVVENDPILREMLQLALEMHDLKVVVAAGRAEALRTTDHFDVAVVDLNLDDGDGLELIETLRQTGRVAQGVIISGSSPRTGCDMTWMRKPFQPSELAETIRELLRRTNEDTAKLA